MVVRHEEWYKQRFPEIARIYVGKGKEGIKTVVILDDNSKGVAFPQGSEQYNPDLGILWAYLKAKEKQEKRFNDLVGGLGEDEDSEKIWYDAGVATGHADGYSEGYRQCVIDNDIYEDEDEDDEEDEDCDFDCEHCQKHGDSSQLMNIDLDDPMSLINAINKITTSINRRS